MVCFGLFVACRVLPVLCCLLCVVRGSWLLFVVHCSLFGVQLVVHCVWCVVCCLLFVVCECCKWFGVYGLSFVACCLLWAVWIACCLLCCVLFVVC